jgi:hypothetical protein
MDLIRQWLQMLCGVSSSNILLFYDDRSCFRSLEEPGGEFSIHMKVCREVLRASLRYFISREASMIIELMALQCSMAG